MILRSTQDQRHRNRSLHFPDGIPARILKELANEIAPSLCKLFNQSLSLGVVATKWKFANVTPVYKKDDPTLVCNYRPISLLCILSKVMGTMCFQPLLPPSIPLLISFTTWIFTRTIHGDATFRSLSQHLKFRCVWKRS